MMINLTPHDVVVTGYMGTTVYPPSQRPARVRWEYVQYGSKIMQMFEQKLAGIDNLPEPEPGVYYIVSAIMLDAVKKSGRTDCVAPALGHPGTVKNEKGQVVSVPGFIR